MDARRLVSSHPVSESTFCYLIMKHLKHPQKRRELATRCPLLIIYRKQLPKFCYIFVSPPFLATPTACGVLVPQPGIEPVSPALEAQSLKHWTAGGSPSCPPPTTTMTAKMSFHPCLENALSYRASVPFHSHQNKP